MPTGKPCLLRRAAKVVRSLLQAGDWHRTRTSPDATAVMPLHVRWRRHWVVRVGPRFPDTGPPLLGLRFLVAVQVVADQPVGAGQGLVHLGDPLLVEDNDDARAVRRERPLDVRLDFALADPVHDGAGSGAQTGPQSGGGQQRGWEDQADQGAAAGAWLSGLKFRE